MTSRHTSVSQHLPACGTAVGIRRHVDFPDWAGRGVLAMMFLAAVAMLSLPQAREASATFGWLPLWLGGLPASAWLALAVARHRTGTR